MVTVAEVIETESKCEEIHQTLHDIETALDNDDEDQIKELMPILNQCITELNTMLGYSPASAIEEA